MAEFIPDGLEKKAGPLPVWVWGVGIGVVAVGYIWWTGREVATAPDETTAANAGESGSIPFDAIDGSFKPSAPSGSVSIPALESPGEIDTNNAWGFRAVAFLVGKGVAPVTAQMAINNYLDEKVMTDAQSKLLNQAIAGIGSPPERVSIATPTPAPTTPAPKAATIKGWGRLNTGQFYTIMSDGKRQNRTLTEYWNANSPKLTYGSAYEWNSYKVKSNSETYATIAKKYDTSMYNIMVLNGKRTAPNLKKGNTVKVPARKGTGKS